MVIKYPKGPSNIPNGHKIYQKFVIEGPPKCTQIGIFGLKINHLATLHSRRGCQIFLDTNIYIYIYIPNGHIIYQPFPFQGTSKFTQIGIFGLKKITIWQPQISRYPANDSRVE
jgi:hypothetical protein